MTPERANEILQTRKFTNKDKHDLWVIGRRVNPYMPVKQLLEKIASGDVHPEHVKNIPDNDPINP